MNIETVAELDAAQYQAYLAMCQSTSAEQSVLLYNSWQEAFNRFSEARGELYLQSLSAPQGNSGQDSDEGGNFEGKNDDSPIGMSSNETSAEPVDLHDGTFDPQTAEPVSEADPTAEMDPEASPTDSDEASSELTDPDDGTFDPQTAEPVSEADPTAEMDPEASPIDSDEASSELTDPDYAPELSDDPRVPIEAALPILRDALERDAAEAANALHQLDPELGPLPTSINFTPIPFDLGDARGTFHSPAGQIDFDPTGALRYYNDDGSQIAQTATSLLAHEMLHQVGVGIYSDNSAQATTWQNNVVEIIGSDGKYHGYFVGVNAMSIYGGMVPLAETPASNGQPSHIYQHLDPMDLATVGFGPSLLMHKAPAEMPTTMSALDLAILHDLGL